MPKKDLRSVRERRDDKQDAYALALPARDQLLTAYKALQGVPRTTVACRQLGVIIGHLAVWTQRYMPDLAAQPEKLPERHSVTPEEAPTENAQRGDPRNDAPTREELDAALKILRGVIQRSTSSAKH